MPSSRLSDLDIARAFVCPHWPYWERFGDPALKRADDEADSSDLFERLWSEQAIIDGIAPEAAYVSLALSPAQAAETTEKLMRAGEAAIAHPTLMTETRYGQPSLLVRKDGHSQLGDYLYVPIDIRRGIHLRKDEAFRLFFYGELLREIQGAFPTSYTFVNRDGLSFDAPLDQSAEEYRVFIENLRRTIEGECPSPVYRKGCQDTSPWGKACLQLAQSKDDISLLFSISQKQMAGLRSQGVETVHQAAEMDPAQLENTSPGLTLRSLIRLQRQARSLVDRSALVRSPWPTEAPHTHVFFDIESHPGTDEDYLYGFLVRDEHGNERWERIDTFKGGDESHLWRDFLAFVRTLPRNYRVYHYGDYETQRLRTLALRYQTNDPWLEAFLANMIDVKELVRDALVLPLFFYSIKAVATFLGYRWREAEIRHGRDSVRLYEQWLETRDPEIARALATYNEDDVRGLAHTVVWAETWAAKEGLFLPPYPWETPSATLGA